MKRIIFCLFVCLLSTTAYGQNWHIRDKADVTLTGLISNSSRMMIETTVGIKAVPTTSLAEALRTLYAQGTLTLGPVRTVGAGVVADGAYDITGNTNGEILSFNGRRVMALVGDDNAPALAGADGVTAMFYSHNNIPNVGGFFYPTSGNGEVANQVLTFNGTDTFVLTTLDTSVITESGNLYYTDARARTALSATTGISYNSSTGVIGFDASVYSVSGDNTGRITVTRSGTTTTLNSVLAAGTGITITGTSIANSGVVTFAVDSSGRLTFTKSGTALTLSSVLNAGTGISITGTTINNTGPQTVAVDASGRLTYNLTGTALTLSSVLNAGSGISITGTTISANVITMTLNTPLLNLSGSVGNISGTATTTAGIQLDSLGVSTTYTTANALSILTQTASRTGIKITGTTGQSGNYLTVVNQTGNNWLDINSSGILTVTGSPGMTYTTTPLNIPAVSSTGVYYANIGGMYFSQSSNGSVKSMSAMTNTGNTTNTTNPYGFSMESGGGMFLRTISSRYIELDIDATTVGYVNISGFGITSTGLYAATAAQVTPTANLWIQPYSTSKVGIQITGTVGQSADLINVVNSTGTTLFNVSAGGLLSVRGTSSNKIHIGTGNAVYLVWNDTKMANYQQMNYESGIAFSISGSTTPSVGILSVSNGILKVSNVTNTGVGSIQTGGLGAYYRNITTTGPTLLTTTDAIVTFSAAGGAISGTLPDALAYSGQMLFMKNTGSVNVTLSGGVTGTQAQQTIDGSLNTTITASGGILRAFSTGTNWISF